jgi:predicted GIY-YIG superfamily endonuclease
MGQLLLISDPKPLVERLGRKFFRDAPKRPGVYLMRDAADKIIYVGKAKNLRQRLRNYRTANPDKMPRRHLKMLRQVARIEFRFARNETSALKNESALIRSLKPKFNRAGVWPGKTKFIVWRVSGDIFELAVTETPEPAWQRFGPMNSSAGYLHQTISRLLWLALNPTRAYGELPTGWARGNISETVAIYCSQPAAEIAAQLNSYFGESPDKFLLWLGEKFTHRNHTFERFALESELKFLTEFAARQKRSPQLGLL